MTIDLGHYTRGGFTRGASKGKECLWILISFLLFRLCPFSLSGLKVFVLRCFGAKVGCGTVIKPDVRITFPWRLELGDHVWLGDECRLLNLAPIVIGSHCCISQQAYLCTGNHDYGSSTFDLRVEGIRIGDGAWIGMGAWVGPGVDVGDHAVLTARSVAATNLAPWGIYRGHPATLVRVRKLAR